MFIDSRKSRRAWTPQWSELTHRRPLHHFYRRDQALSQRRQFRLNFERHTPETVELYVRPIRRGDKVRFLAPRGEPTASVDHSLWRVTGITRNDGERVEKLMPAEHTEPAAEHVERAVEDLVVVAEFRDPIYPIPVYRKGAARRRHAVPHGHQRRELPCAPAPALHARGQGDAIYIDPPYNTGAKDWKYNNDYVDAYRDSEVARVHGAAAEAGAAPAKP